MSKFAKVEVDKSDREYTVSELRPGKLHSWFSISHIPTLYWKLTKAKVEVDKSDRETTAST